MVTKHIICLLKFIVLLKKLLFKVANFSRKTGDYSNLSAVDLQLLSLTYQLCKENLTPEEFSQLKLEPTKASVNNYFFMRHGSLFYSTIKVELS